MTQRPPTVWRRWEPDPTGISRRSQDFARTNALLTLLKGKDQFYRGPGQAPTFDWPNPKTPFQFHRGYHWDAQTQLIGRDRFFRGPGQAPTYDWPNPKTPFQFHRGYHWNAQVKLIGKDQFTAGGTDFDWPNPKTPFQPDRGFTFSASLALNTIVAVPFSQDDWPNPRTPYQPDRTFLKPTPLNLIGQDQFFGEDGETSNYDLSLPKSAPQPNRGYVQSTPPQLLAVAFPFAQYDWPSPKSAAQPDRTFINQTNQNLIGQDQFFGAPGEAPTYSYPLAPRPDAFRSFIWPAQIQFLVTAAPFAQYDWPVPRAAPSNINRSWALSVTPGQLLPPFAQTDWPPPRGSFQPGRAWSVSASLALGASIVPISNYDLRVPQRPPQPDRSFTIAQSALTLPPPVAAPRPFVQTDWPLPRGAEFPLSLRTSVTLNISLYTAAPIVVTAAPWSGFIGNTGRMMIRRG